MPSTLGRALVEAYLTNERINQVLLDLLDPNVWRAQPPCAKRRNIATTFAHMHNVRCMRLKMSHFDEEPPSKLDCAEVTPVEADGLDLGKVLPLTKVWDWHKQRRMWRGLVAQHSPRHGANVTV